MLHATSARPDPNPSTSIFSVPIDPMDPTFGPKNAKVTVVETFEFLCPYSHAGSHLISRLMADFPNDVRVVAKYRIIHGGAALPGAALFAAAKQGKAFEMHNRLWNMLWDASSGGMRVENVGSGDAVLRLGKVLSLDMDAFVADIRSKDAIEWIERGEKLMDNFHIRTVPNFFVNGRFTPRVRYEEFKRIVEQELAKPSQPYEEIVAAGEVKARRDYRLFD